jgi:hypothetical protein
VSALNAIGLTSRIANLISARNESSRLRGQCEAAEKELRANSEFIASVESELGAHARAVNHSEIVIVGSFAAFIPLPSSGYKETRVHVEILTPKGL